MMDPREKWKECKDYLQASIPPSLFEAFIRPLDLEERPATGELKLHSPADSEALRHIESRYLPVIQAFLQKNGYKGQVRLGRKHPPQNLRASSLSSPAPNNLSESPSRGKSLAFVSEGPTKQNAYCADYANPQIEASPPPFYPARSNAAFIRSLLEGAQRPILLSITGASGSGKTHLGRLLVHRAEKQGMAAHYLSLESFLSEFSLACKKRDTVSWRNALRSNRLLIIDDFHFLKPSALKSSEELQHLMDDCQASGRSLILLSQKSLSSMQLPESLSSRLRCLTELALEYPETSERLKILREALQEKEIELPDRLCRFLAERISRDMRLLKSVPDRLMAWKLSGSFPLDEGRLEELLGDLFTKAEKIEPRRVLELVAEFYRLPVSQITGPARNKGPSLARHLVAWICTEDLGMSQKEAAALIGRSDHGSVIHARKKISELLQNDLFFAGQLSQIRRRLFEA